MLRSQAQGHLSELDYLAAWSSKPSEVPYHWNAGRIYGLCIVSILFIWVDVFMRTFIPSLLSLVSLYSSQHYM